MRTVVFCPTCRNEVPGEDLGWDVMPLQHSLASGPCPGSMRRVDKTDVAHARAAGGASGQLAAGAPTAATRPVRRPGPLQMVFGVLALLLVAAVVVGVLLFSWVALLIGAGVMAIGSLVGAVTGRRRATGAGIAPVD